jgi:hypothetical protein
MMITPELPPMIEEGATPAEDGRRLILRGAFLGSLESKAIAVDIPRAQQQYGC